MALSSLKGILSPADIMAFSDALAGALKRAAPTLGLNLPGEAGTVAASAHTARITTLGDGTTSFPGLGYPDFQAGTREALDSLVNGLRWDTIFQLRCRNLINQLNANVQNNKPQAWNLTSSTVLQPFDGYLLRLNSALAPVLVANIGTGAATATANAAGVLPSTASNAPWFVYTMVGDADYKESLPSPAFQGATLAGANNAYSVAITTSPTTVPTGVNKIRVYRTYFGEGSGATKKWDSDFTAIPGSAYPSIIVTRPDSALRADINPPSWMQCLVLPEFAAIFALAYANPNTSNPDAVLQLIALGMLSPSNVALIPSNGVLGLGNNVQSGLFGRSTIGGAATQTYAAGSIQTGNSDAANVQGFAGSLATATGTIQARVTQSLGGAGTVTINYTYSDAATGALATTTITGATATCSGTTVGSTAVFTIPAGRIVRSVTVTAVSGMGGAGGEFVMESQAPRTY